MADEFKIDILTGDDVRDVKKWARKAVPKLNAAIEKTVNPGSIFVWNRGCLTPPQDTDITGATEITFKSPFPGLGTLLITGVGFEGGINVALNGTELGPLSNADTTSKILYELTVSNLIIGFNTFKIWSTSSDVGEMLKLEVRGVDMGGFNAAGALGSESTLNSGVTQFETGGVTTRRLTQGLAFVAATDGQAFVFDPVRAEIPDILFFGGGRGQPTGTMAALDWHREVLALNTSTSGFDISALFKVAPGSPIPVTDAISAGTVLSWEIEKSVAPEDNTKTYIFQYDVTVEKAKTLMIEGEPVVLDSSVTIAFDTRTTLAGAWTERGTRVFSNSDPVNQDIKTDLIKNVIVDGLLIDAAFRVRVKSEAQLGGELPAFDSVKYTHGGSGSSTQTMTPGTGEQPLILMISNGVEATVS